MLSNFWHVRLGEGGRLMTNSQIGAAVARCWIDEETQVRRPRSADWTKLGDAVSPKEKRRITEEPVVVSNIETSAMVLLSGEYEIVADLTDVKRKQMQMQLETSAMTILSGEYEIVSDERPLSKEELSTARPPRLAPKLFAAAILVLAGAGYVAHRRVPAFETKLHAITAAMSSLGTDLAPAKPAPAVVAVETPAPVAQPITVSASSTVYLVPKMRAPTPPPPQAMPEPSPPRVAAVAKQRTVPAKPPPHVQRGVHRGRPSTS